MTTNADQLLGLLGGAKTPTPEEFKRLIQSLDNHRVLAKVFLLEGTPFVFEKSPMKYVIFREQVADRFDVGSQDVCIVGSAKLGYSPSPHTYGTPFDKTSDVDVVLISEPLFYRGSRELFSVLNDMEPTVYEIRQHQESGKAATAAPAVDLRDWRKVKEAVRNFVYENFNPGLLPFNHALRREIFDSLASTSGLFLALEPKVLVSKIRGRIFRTWKAAEDYYSNSLREAKAQLTGESTVEPEIDEAEELKATDTALELATPIKT